MIKIPLYEYDFVTVNQVRKSIRETVIDVDTTTGDNRMCAVISQTLDARVSFLKTNSYISESISTKSKTS
jgi:hypothetical protein